MSMKFLPAALTSFRPKKQAQKKQGTDISITTAAALSFLAVITVFIIGEAYLSKVILTVDERNALLNTLLLCDIVIFSISLLITAILWYLSSVYYGSRDSHSLLKSKALYFYGILMLLPIIFVATDLSFKPMFFMMMEVEIALALSAIGIIALVPFSVGILEYIKPGGIIVGLLEEIAKEFDEAGYNGPVEPAALQRPVLRGNAGTSLATLFNRLCESGDIEPVIHAIEQMKEISLEAREPFKDIKSIALSSGLVSMMSEAAYIAAKRGRHEVVYRAVDELLEVASTSGHQGISSLAFRSMGAIFDVCATCFDERALSRLETKLMEAYTVLYDRSGKPEALDMAVAMAEKASASRIFATEEFDGILYVTGGVYRRMAEAKESEDHANKALTVLYEALTARTAEASPLDHACIKGEIGRAYLALAKIKNPVKSYRSAASAFEEAGKMLDPKISPWDAALYRGKAACSYTMLAEEYCRTKRYDDAIQAARSALALYDDAVKFFQRRSPESYVETISNLGLAHTIISEVYLKSRMFDLSLKHAQQAIDSYTSAAHAIDLKLMPERYAFTRTNIGLTHVTMAEIHFREKRYENAITSCDSAIAAYNEALRIYDDKGREKPAATTRKHLKKANDLFSTMMRIGVADRKPLLVEQ